MFGDNPVLKQLLDEYFRERRYAETQTTRINALESEASRQRNEIWELKQKLKAATTDPETGADVFKGDLDLTEESSTVTDAND